VTPIIPVAEIIVVWAARAALPGAIRAKTRPVFAERDGGAKVVNERPKLQQRHIFVELNQVFIVPGASYPDSL